MIYSLPVRPSAGLVDIAAALIADGGAPILFERVGAPSLMIAAPALTVRFDGRAATVTPETDAGRALMRGMGDRFVAARGRATWPAPDGHDLDERLTAPGPFDVLRALVGMGGAPFVFGLLAFEHAHMFEALPPPPPDLTGVPDGWFVVPDRWLSCVDGVMTAHGWSADAAAALAARAEAAGPLDRPPPAPVLGAAAVDLSDGAYGIIVSACRERIAAGELFQIVPSRTFSAPCADAFAAYRRLRAADPSPAMFHVPGPGWTLIGASPETAVRVSADATVEVKPIAGTRGRGRDLAEDLALEAELLGDDKELAEHRMLIDLARNDVARVSVPGTRIVTNALTVQRQARVMHLVSTVTGRLRPGLDALHALQACMNMGTLSGAPKLRATELLRTIEPTRRGHYGGALGVFGRDGALDTALVIRSALVRDGTAEVRAGAGVVWDSDPQAEADETRRKAGGVLAALGAAA